jgi:predicted small lipoprotein YifL
MKIRSLLAIAAVFALAACGGGGGGGNSTPTAAVAPAVQATAEGLYTGKSSANEAIEGLVTADGHYYVLFGTGNVINGVVLGQGASNNGSFSSLNGKDFVIGQSAPSNVTVSASYVAKTSLNGSLTGPGGTETFTATYNSTYDTTVTPAQVARTYSGSAATLAGSQSATLTLNASGNWTGVSGACQFAGGQRNPSSTTAFDLQLTFAGTGCQYAGQTLAGEGVFDLANKQVFVVIPTNDNNVIIFVGH